MCCGVLRCEAGARCLAQLVCRGGVLRCVAVCCGVLRCVVVCCNVLQCVAVYCSVLWYFAVRDSFRRILEFA